MAPENKYSKLIMMTTLLLSNSHNILLGLK